MKVRSMITVGAAAGALFFGSAFAANAAGPNSGSCTNTRNSGPSVLPVADPTGQAPNLYAQQTTATGGDAGVDGSHGYLEAGGDATSGGYVSGENPDSGLNGTLTIGSSPSLCLGDSVAGVGVQGP